MSNEQLITIAFKLINFIIIVGGSALLFRKYVSPALSQHIVEKESLIASLHERTTLLRQEQHLIEERMVHDKKYAELLVGKIERWRTSVHEQREKEAMSDERLQAALEQKHAEQQKRVKQDSLNKQVLPQALKLVVNALEKEYAHEDQQEKFMHDIIQSIKHR